MADTGEKSYIAKEETLQQVLNKLENFSSTAIKSIQRGVTSAAGTVTINAVNVNKCKLYSVSKGSAGTVAARGTVSMNAANVNISRSAAESTYSANESAYSTSHTTETFTGTVAAHTGSLSGGTTDLTTKQYSAVLTNSTTITCDGPVEWQLIEYL